MKPERTSQQTAEGFKSFLLANEAILDQISNFDFNISIMPESQHIPFGHMSGKPNKTAILMLTSLRLTLGWLSGNSFQYFHLSQIESFFETIEERKDSKYLYTATIILPSHLKLTITQETKDPTKMSSILSWFFSKQPSKK